MDYFSIFVSLNTTVMTWTGFWDGFASIFEDYLFIPFNALMKLEIENWWLANFMSWFFIAIAASAFIYWILFLRKEDEDTESHYTYDDTITYDDKK